MEAEATKGFMRMWENECKRHHLSREQHIKQTVALRSLLDKTALALASAVSRLEELNEVDCEVKNGNSVLEEVAVENKAYWDRLCDRLPKDLLDKPTA